jgi:hypothetical protein
MSRHAAALAAMIILSAAGGSGQHLGELDTGFRIHLGAQDRPVPGVFAQVTTTATYPCAGYGLRLSVRADHDTVTLAIHGMIRPSPCVQSMDPASGTAYLFARGERTFILKISYRGEADFHQCALTASGIRLTPLQSRFTVVSWTSR